MSAYTKIYVPGLVAGEDQSKPVFLLGVDDGNGGMTLKSTLTVGDIEIGAVELKDGATDTRATVNAANTARTVGTTVLAVQVIDAAGNVLPSRPVGTPTDGSGTITLGGTAQQVFAANVNRRYFVFQNNSDIDYWINWGVAAVASQPSIQIVAGGSYENPPHFCPTGTISVIGATTGKPFTAKEA